MPTLILSPRHTPDSQALWRAAGRAGWAVERLSGWRVPSELLSLAEPVLYLEALMAPTIAEQFGLRLLGPSEDWLPSLPPEHRRRWVRLSTLGAERGLAEPAFVKPPNDKCFTAGVYLGSTLPREFDDAMPVLVAEVVRWEREYRVFVLDRQPRAMSVYLRDGELQRDRDFAASDAELAEAEGFVRTVLADERVPLPRTAVLDVGVIADRGWAVVEQNAAWGAGIYGCDPTEVLTVLRHSAEPISARA